MCLQLASTVTYTAFRFKNSISAGRLIEFADLGGTLLGPLAVVTRACAADIFVIEIGQKPHHKILANQNGDTDVDEAAY
jgi:hypothetical protein